MVPADRSFRQSRKRQEGRIHNDTRRIDELGEDDKLTVSRARKIERFFSQPMYVAEQFTGIPGKYVPIKETVRGFREILDGKHDLLPEQAFYMVGSIEDAVARAKELEAVG